jgi:hypothetical protein
MGQNLSERSNIDGDPRNVWCEDKNEIGIAIIMKKSMNDDPKRDYANTNHSHQFWLCHNFIFLLPLSILALS